MPDGPETTAKLRGLSPLQPVPHRLPVSLSIRRLWPIVRPSLFLTPAAAPGARCLSDLTHVPVCPCLSWRGLGVLWPIVSSSLLLLLLRGERCLSGLTLGLTLAHGRARRVPVWSHVVSRGLTLREKGARCARKEKGACLVLAPRHACLVLAPCASGAGAAAGAGPGAGEDLTRRTSPDWGNPAEGANGRMRGLRRRVRSGCGAWFRCPVRLTDERLPVLAALPAITAILEFKSLTSEASRE